MVDELAKQTLYPMMDELARRALYPKVDELAKRTLYPMTDELAKRNLVWRPGCPTMCIGMRQRGFVQPTKPVSLMDCVPGLLKKNTRFSNSGP